MAARFEAVQQASWGSLLSLLLRDESAAQRRRERRELQAGKAQPDPAETEARLRKSVLYLVRCGQVGKARRRVASFGIADITNPLVEEAVKAKYPPRSHPMPDSVTAGSCMESMSELKETLLNLQPGVSSGFWGSPSRTPPVRGAILGGERGRHPRAVRLSLPQRQTATLDLQNLGLC